MPAAAAISRVLAAAKPLLRNSRAAPSMIRRRRLPSSSSPGVLRGLPRARRVSPASTGSANPCKTAEARKGRLEAGFATPAEGKRLKLVFFMAAKITDCLNFSKRLLFINRPQTSARRTRPAPVPRQLCNPRGRQHGQHAHLAGANLRQAAGCVRYHQRQLPAHHVLDRHGGAAIKHMQNLVAYAFLGEFHR